MVMGTAHSRQLHHVPRCKEVELCVNHAVAVHLKILAMAVIFVASILGVCMPVIGQNFSALRNDGRVVFVLKSFAAGVVLATGYVHMLPDAFHSLDNPCLPEYPWRQFPFAGFVTMISALGTLLVDFCGTVFYGRRQVGDNSFVAKPKALTMVAIHRQGVEQKDQSLPMDENEGFSNAELSTTRGSEEKTQQRYRIISQVLELGVVAHSLIIGISMGSSNKPCIIRPLMAALSFHQFFEGIALGGCIAQASFKRRVVMIMIFFFSMTTPVGIAIGMAISSIYNGRSPTALIVEGLMDSVSAGILAYMALVDLIAADFLSDRLLCDSQLQVFAFSALFCGAGLTSFIAMWA